MILLIYEDGTATTLLRDITDAHMAAFDAGVLDVFDISEPVTRLQPDLTWEEVTKEKTQ